MIYATSYTVLLHAMNANLLAPEYLAKYHTRITIPPSPQLYFASRVIKPHYGGGIADTKLFRAASCVALSVHCESRNTKLNVRCFGDYIHLEEDKQQASKPCRTPRSYIS
jgi:hypothetical protein